MSWFILFLILFTSLVVAVSASQLRALPKKGNRLLLTCLLWLVFPSIEGSVAKRLIAGIMMGLYKV